MYQINYVRDCTYLGRVRLRIQARVVSQEAFEWTTRHTLAQVLQHCKIFSTMLHPANAQHMTGTTSAHLKRPLRIADFKVLTLHDSTLMPFHLQAVLSHTRSLHGQ